LLASAEPLLGGLGDLLLLIFRPLLELLLLLVLLLPLLPLRRGDGLLLPLLMLLQE